METEAIQTGKKVQVSNDVVSKYETMKEELRSRGVTGFTFSKFLDLVFEKTKESTLSDIVEENTPAKFRIHEASKDPSLMEEFLKLIEKNKKRHIKQES